MNSIFRPRGWTRLPAADDETVDQEQSLIRPSPRSYRYRNVYRETFEGTTDGSEPMYLSSTKHIPQRLKIQTNDTEELKFRDFSESTTRVEVTGQVPLALSLTEWARRPLSSTSRLWLLDAVARILVLMCLTPVLYVSLYIHFYCYAEKSDQYKSWPGHVWEWPKHALNRLDMRPATYLAAQSTNQLSVKVRRLHPRQLVIRKGNAWNVENLDEHPRHVQPYIFISYINAHFDTDNSEEDRSALELVAQELAVEAGCNAYWLDFHCRAPPNASALLTKDINRFGDVVKGSTRVVVVLPDGKAETAATWGSRIGTLVEGLLASGPAVYYRSLGDSKTTSLTKIQMTETIWTDLEYLKEKFRPTRLLAEHCTGTLSLGRLELFSTAFKALVHRSLETNGVQRSDLTYALTEFMGLRVESAFESETLFQSLARISLHNDTDKLLERILCMLPAREYDKHIKKLAELSIPGSFTSLYGPDQYGTQLWDIDPLCRVVGVGGDPDSLVLDGCRTIPIQWDRFPRICLEPQRSKAGKSGPKANAINLEKLAAWFVSVTKLILLSLVFVPYGLTFLVLIVASLVLLIVLLFNVRSLFGGAKVISPPRLVAFEGTMPIDELETKILGFSKQRLSYEASSTPFNASYRRPEERLSTEPPWITDPAEAVEPPIAPGHRLFTIVDTGSLTVSIFEAVEPPTVALLAGLEGGTMRVVLCSWDVHRDCLVKQTVLRLSSTLLDRAPLKGWIVSFQ